MKINFNLIKEYIKSVFTSSDKAVYDCNYVNTELDKKRNNGSLLYTNSNIGVTFSSQTINFNDDYSYYDIVISQDSQILETKRVYVGDSSVDYLLTNCLNGFIRNRGVKVFSNKLVFGDAIFYETYNNYSTNNAQCVPYKIIGYK